MELPVVFILTHDSIGVGEDGPTHQPIEQILGLRGIPSLLDLRPADANEVAEAWRVILSRRREPACLILSRQPLPVLDRARYASAAGLARGAYALADPPDGPPQIILIATGSEDTLVADVHGKLKGEGIRSRIVSRSEEH